MNHKRHYFCLVFFASWMLLYVPFCIAIETKITPEIFIAHAGGAFNDQTYTNSLEALNANYAKGFRFFEMDFSWTSDQELVSIHDWDESDVFQGMFYVPKNIKIPTKAQFLGLKTKKGLTQLALEDILRWAESKGDVFIVTDIKDKNVAALSIISKRFKKQQKFIIPQIYNYHEYEETMKLGYPNIILTLYRMKIAPDELLSFAKMNSPFAVTMHWQDAQAGLAYLLYKNNVRVYAHTVNDIKLFSSLTRMGIFGIYTDSITPP